MNSATFSASAPAITSMFPPTARDCSTSGGPRPCWPSCKPHDETSPPVREHRLYLLARVLTEPRRGAAVEAPWVVCALERPYRDRSASRRLRQHGCLHAG